MDYPEVKTDVIFLIKKIIELGYTKDLLEIMTAVSEYNIDSYNKDLFSNESEEKLWHIAMHHLDYLVNYGDSDSVNDEKGHMHFSYREEFDKWLDSGFPGVLPSEIFNFATGKYEEILSCYEISKKYKNYKD